MKPIFTGNLDELKEKIWSLDLEPIMVKLMDPREGEGWSEDQAFTGVEEYRRFLFLTAIRREIIVPTTFIDTVWHTHILDTAKYRDDCQNILGYFLDHFPYFGLRGDDDREALDSSFRETAGIYEEVFGSSYYVNASETSAGNCTCGAQGDCGNNACGQCAGSGIIAKNMMRANERPTLAMYRELNTVH
jgi:hypothetical protein